MGVKRIIDTEFWADEKVIDKFSVEDKYFMLYLLTNPRTTQVGIYRLPKRLMSFETGFTKEVIEVLLQRFEVEYKCIIYNHAIQEIAILNALKYNIVKGGKPVSDLLVRELAAVDDLGLIRSVYDRMVGWWNNSRRSFDKTVMRLFEDEIEKRTGSDLNENDNENDNENENEESYHDSYDDSYHDSFTDRKEQPKKRSGLDYSDLGLEPEVVIVLKEFAAMRKEMKRPLTQRALVLNANKLKGMCGDSATQMINVINQTIERGWQGLFPIGGDRKHKPANMGNFDGRQYSDDEVKDFYMDVRGMGG